MRQSRTPAERAHRKRSLRVVHLIVLNWIGGVVLGAAFAGLLIWFDIGHIGRLIQNASPMWPPLVLLFGGFAVTFGALVAGTAVMLIPRDEDPPDDPPRGPLIPVKVGARARSTR